jgi:predicted ester cyclase
MTRPQIEDLFTRREQAMARQDFAGVSTMYTPEAMVESPTAGGTVTGRAAIEEINRAWFAGFPDVAFTTESLLVDGDRVVWLAAVHGTDAGGFLGLPATGKPFSVLMALLCTMENGLICHERRIYDFNDVLVQIGVLKIRTA